jgi:hypothetical protein
MVESAIRQSKPLPNYAGSAAHEVRLTLAGTVQDPAFIRFLEQLGEECLRSFSTHDFLILDALRQHLAVPVALEARLPGLIDAGVIERHGRGRGARHILSRGLYAALGLRGAYTRERGLDHETNKALLVQHVGQNDTDGCPLADLRQVLPSLSATQVQALLQELRTEGRIRVVGARRWARWHLPLAQDTYHFADRVFFENCNPGTIIMNTSRGNVIDTGALIQSLENNHIGGACLDVFENEKPETFTEEEKNLYERLYRLKNVILSPHIAGWTIESKYLLSKVLLNKLFP